MVYCHPVFGYILGSFEMKNSSILNGHCENFMVIWYMYFKDTWHILWSFGRFYGHLVDFMVIWYILWSFG
jgi:hypothetical protein